MKKVKEYTAQEVISEIKAFKFWDFNIDSISFDVMKELVNLGYWILQIPENCETYMTRVYALGVYPPESMRHGKITVEKIESAIKRKLEKNFNNSHKNIYL